MLKNKSHFKRSMGDEAGCAPKKGVVTSKNMGKVYFIAWSMDVKVEGENVVRMLDMTTHNHGSCPTNTPPQAYVDEATAGLDAFDKCTKEKEAIEKECNEKNGKPCPGPLATPKQRTAAFADKATAAANKDKCAQAIKCFLRPYKDTKGNNSCCEGQTGHHIPPWSTTKSVAGMTDKLKHTNALCICLEGTNHSIGSHGKHHHGINYMLKRMASSAGSAVTATTNAAKNKLYKAPLDAHVKVAAAVTEAQTKCSKQCIEQQLNQQFSEDDRKRTATHNASTTGGESYGRLDTDDMATLVSKTPKIGV